MFPSEPSLVGCAKHREIPSLLYSLYFFRYHREAIAAMDFLIGFLVQEDALRPVFVDMMIVYKQFGVKFAQLP